MAFDAGAAISTLGLDTNPFKSGFVQAQTLMATFPNIVTAFLANPMLGAAQAVTGAFNLIAAGGKAAFNILADAFNTSQANADKLNDMATNAGIAVDRLSGLGIVAKQAGSSVDEVADAMKFVAKNANDALGGNKEAMASFAKFGIDLKDSTGAALPLEEIFNKVGDAIAILPAGLEQTDAAMSLINARSGPGLIAMLSQGSREWNKQIDLAKSWGAVVTKESAASADKFGDMVGDFETRWAGVQNMFAVPFRAALLPLLEKAGAWADTHLPEIQQAVGGFTKELVKGLNDAGAWIDAHQADIKSLMNTLGEGGKQLVSWLKEAFKFATDLNGAVEQLADDLIGPRPETVSVTRSREDALKDRARSGGGSGNVTVNVNTMPSNAGYNEITAGVQKGFRQAEENNRQAAQRSASEMRIADGLSG